MSMGPSFGIDAPKSIHAWAERRRRTSTGRPTRVPCTVREPWIVWGEALRRDPIIVAPPGVVLLWALACEIDDRGATFTGDRVCRACSGRGESIVQVAIGTTTANVFVVSTGCTCDGPTRPDTVSLSWLVAHLASQRTPLFNDWPDQWRVDRDQERAWVDGSWQAQWWLAFEIWVTAGIEPDAYLLAGLLRALTPDAPPFRLDVPAIEPTDWTFQPRRDPATAEFLTLELRTDGYNPQWSESGRTTISGDPGHALIELGAYDCDRAILTGTVRGFGELTVSVWANGVQIVTHTRRMFGTMEEVIVLDADIDPGWQNLEVRAEAWVTDVVVQGGTDAEVAQSII